jgi:uncharacterized protein
MPYLVDGNNVMATFHSNRIVARRMLIEALIKFISANHVKLKVVFDGVPDDEFPENLKFKSVHILYARPGSDADSRIKDILRVASYKRDITLVSSDRELALFARNQGARCISAQDFRAMLEDARVSVRNPYKTGHAPIDVQYWLDYFQGY